MMPSSGIESSASVVIKGVSDNVMVISDQQYTTQIA